MRTAQFGEEAGTGGGMMFPKGGSMLVLLAASVIGDPGTAGATAASAGVVIEDAGTSSKQWMSTQYPDLLVAAEAKAESSNADSTSSRLDDENQHGSEANCQDAIADLRRIAGLTWEQLARICGVTRRTLHNWASGKPTSASSEERIRRLLGTLQRLDRGSSVANHKLLLGAVPSGELVLDLLQRGEFERIVEQFGESDTMQRRPMAPLSRAAAMERRPESLVQRLSLVEQHIAQEARPVRRARAVRVGRGERK